MFMPRPSKKATPRTPAPSGSRALVSGVATPLALMAALGPPVGCGAEEPEADRDAVVIGTALPFTGEEATIARNLEQAMLLAVEDVKKSVVAAPRLRLEIRDSRSGASRGLDGLLELLYEEHVKYLIGPEENELADEIVPDIKGLDVFNLLPGYASPKIERVGRKAAWLRLSPSHLGWGCGIAELAVHQ